MRWWDWGRGRDGREREKEGEGAKRIVLRICWVEFVLLVGICIEDMVEDVAIFAFVYRWEGAEGGGELRCLL